MGIIKLPIDKLWSCGKRNEVFARPANWLELRIDLERSKSDVGTRLAEAGCDAFTIAKLLGHSDVRVTMRYVRAVEDTKQVAVESSELSVRKNVQVLASWPNSQRRRWL